MSTTSSDSSEDEEEARKINEAVGVFAISTAEQTASAEERPFSKVPTDSHGKPLKSNRPKLVDGEEDDGNVLQTTPEFRAHVAKQLSQVLDRELATQVEDKCWKTPDWIESLLKEHGIRLFSDSTTLFRLENNLSSSPVKKEQVPKRKRRISTSTSSSSDNDDIQACVFSVQDIDDENRRLSQFEEDQPSRKKLGRFANVKFVAAKSLKQESINKAQSLSSGDHKSNNSKVELNKDAVSSNKRKKKPKKIRESKDGAIQGKAEKGVKENSCHEENDDQKQKVGDHSIQMGEKVKNVKENSSNNKTLNGNVEENYQREKKRKKKK